MINLNWYTFSDLSIDKLYAVLALRAAVFIVDQHCAYLDPDGEDLFALHLLGMEKNRLVAYLRLFPPRSSKNYIVFGRVVTAKSARNKGYGKKLIQELLNYCSQHFKGIRIECSAQLYLKEFYTSFGFRAYGKTYQEDGIPHIAMQKTDK